MVKILYIDPQSYNNLEKYDYGVLSSIKDFDIYFFGSVLWKGAKIPNAHMNLWFNYNLKSNPINKAFSYAKTIFKIVKYINKIKPQIVHIQWLRLWIVDLTFVKYLKSRGIIIVFTAHNILPHDTGNKHFNQFKKFYSIVDSIIVHSEKTKSELCDRFNINDNKVSVIPHGIINLCCDEKLVLDNMISFSKKYQLKGKKIFSSLGLQSKYKGIDVLIDVWSKSKEFKDNDDVRLILAGINKGIDYSPVKNIKNVILMDWKLTDEEFISLTRLSNIILLPYREISQSGVLFTAISNNVPVLVSNAGGLSEPLKIGNIGINIGDLTFNHLYESLLNILDDEILISFNNVTSFEKVKKFYSWNTISLKTQNLYKTLIHNVSV